MHKRLRILVPIVQGVLILSTFFWYKLSSPDAMLRYAGPARDIVIKLNFPLLVLWLPILYVLERFPRALSPSQLSTQAVGALVFGLVAIATVEVFWYFVVVEAEARRRGESIIRLQNSLAEAIKAAGLFLSGFGALVYAYTDTRRLLVLERSRADAFIGGLFLVGWGGILIGLAAQDSAVLARKKSKKMPSPTT